MILEINKGHNMDEQLQISKLEKKLEIAKKALEFYADTDNWLQHPDFYFEHPIIVDDFREQCTDKGDELFGGNTAVDALQDIEEV